MDEKMKTKKTYLHMEESTTPGRLPVPKDDTDLDVIGIDRGS